MPKIEIPLATLRERSVFVATPMYGGQCFGAYTKSCVDLQAIFNRFGIQNQFYFLFNESLITRARNYLVDEFLRSKCTHLMFIDSDIDYNPMDVIALLSYDKDIIGGPYPKKTLAWEKIYDAARMGLADKNPLLLEQYAGDYVFNPAPNQEDIGFNAPVKVLEIGTGFMMAKREVFPKFAAAYPQQMFKPDHNRTKDFNGDRAICAYFDTVIDPDTKRYLSEDYMFCQWSRKIGIDVHLCPWMKMRHAGTYIYGGSLDSLARLQAAQREHGYVTPVSRDINETVAPVKLEKK